MGLVYILSTANTVIDDLLDNRLKIYGKDSTMTNRGMSLNSGLSVADLGGLRIVGAPAKRSGNLATAAAAD